MSRVVATLIAVIAVLFGVIIRGPAVAAAAPAALTYSYNDHHVAAVVAHTYTERGPPTARDLAMDYKAVGDASSGAAARPDTGKTPAAFAYDHPALLVQVASVAVTTERQEQATLAPLSSLARSGVVVRTATGAESALSGALLRTHLRQLEKYGAGGFRELESGRFRYYGELSPASKSGDRDC